MAFRILSLDGGGIKGAFSAGCLAALEKATTQRVADHFDLISGTSTGGIIAIGLGLGFSAQEIVEFYEQHGPRIFPSTGVLARATRSLFHFVRPKRHLENLRAALSAVWGRRRFGESKIRLVIPTYDALAGRIFLLKTAHHAQLKYDVNALAVDVGLATAAAPTYFSAARFPEHGNAQYIDGGVWANCPVMVGLTEAVHFLNVPLSEIRVLSISTTSAPFNVHALRRSGLLRWSLDLVPLMFHAQCGAALAQADLLLRGHLYRIDRTLMPNQFAMDDSRHIRDLIALGRGAAVEKATEQMVRDHFLNGEKTAPFIAATCSQ